MTAALKRFFVPLVLLATAVVAQPQQPASAAELQLALNKLTVAGSALFVAAHPDDENTAMLAWLENEKLVRAAYLAMTRGEGGQNLIGSEKSELLGVIRTHELLAARRIDGAEQFFTRATDFGYSKTPEETLRIWGKDRVLSDVVWVIRSFQPDVIITRFSASGEGGHGHHTSSAILANEAFTAAADPARFPEQLKFVKPWQAKRLVWNAFQRRPADAAVAPDALTVDLGAFNELLGRSYTEIAADSRSMHKSQGFGSAERRGALPARLQHIAGHPASRDLFDGVDLSWNRFAGGAEVGELLRRAAREFQSSDPSAVVPLLVRAHTQMRSLPDEPLVRAKRREILDVIRAASGLWIEAISAIPSAPPGTDVKIVVTAVNRGSLPMQWLATDSAWSIASPRESVDLKENQPAAHELTIRIPADAQFSHPYWLNETIPQQLVGLAENPPAASVTTRIAVGGEQLEFDLPVLFRNVDRVRGELYRPFLIAPAVTLRIPRPLQLFVDHRAQTVELTLHRNPSAPKPVAGTASLETPSPWKSTPPSQSVQLGDEHISVAFEVTPPSTQSAVDLRPHVNADRDMHRSEVRIDHIHIPPQTLFPRATARLVRLDVKKRGSRVAYVMGPGDDIPEALRQIGYEVDLLTDADLERGDLGRYDAIVTGIRAYNTRDALRRAQRRLLDYVHQGGTLVVQYNTSDESLPESLGPYPLKLSRDRVSVEEAPVRILAPDHPLMSQPNRITARDFEGWVQERGLYFPGEFDPRYEPLIATNDPGESEKRGALLVARYGKGVYVHTGLAFFRQLPAGVPGAYRLFANLVSARGQ